MKFQPEEFPLYDVIKNELRGEFFRADLANARAGDAEDKYNFALSMSQFVGDEENCEATPGLSADIVKKSQQQCAEIFNALAATYAPAATMAAHMALYGLGCKPDAGRAQILLDQAEIIGGQTPVTTYLRRLADATQPRPTKGFC